MKNDKTYAPFSLMALVVPAAEAAVGKNYLPTLILALAAFLLCTWVSGLKEPDWKWLAYARWAAVAFLLAWSLNWTHICWPGKNSSYVVPGALLILAMYAVWRGSAARAASVLRYGMYLILFILAVLGIPQIKTEDLRPMAQVPDMQLAAVLLLPMLAKKTGTWEYRPIGLAAVAAAILTVGQTTLYEYSRGISIGGVTEHMESLAACAMTVGYFALLCYLLDGIRRAEKNWQIWVMGLAAYGLYASGAAIRPEVSMILLLVFWAVLPALWNLKNHGKKTEKNA